MDFQAVEAKWQNRWIESKLFEPKTEKGRKKFFFHVPYPYVSGSLHVGHGRTYTVGDVFARYKRMQGFAVMSPMAFHITGTPVLAITAKIADGDAQTIQLHKDYVTVYEKDAAKAEKIVASFGKDPWNVVNYYSGKLVYDFWRMGFSLDLSRQFTTGDPEYNKFIEWQFQTYKNKGFLKQAAYPILYCVRDKNAVGEDDIKDGDSDPVSVQPFTGFLFAFDEGFLVSSTLRPDTAFGITNMFANPQAVYVKAEVDGKVLYFAKPFLEKISLQNHRVKPLGEMPGSYFLGKTCTTPLGKTVPVLPGPFIDPENASGFVHSVPAHAPFDLVALADLKKDPAWKSVVEKIEPIPVISVPGFGPVPARDLVDRMKIANQKEKGKLEKATAELYKKEFYEGRMLDVNGEFAGMPVAQAKEKMAAWLKNKSVAMDVYESSRPAVCRCGGHVVVAVLPDQWFLDFSAPGWKDLAHQALAGTELYPPVYRKQFEDVFAWLDKRPCARRRGLGTPLPFNKDWIIESLSDSTIYLAFYPVIKKIRALNLKPDQLTPSFFDFVFLGKGTGTDASKAVREEFLYWYPIDHYHTAVAHLTNHLSFFFFAHAAIFHKEHWPKKLTLNELVISEGSKMSKSKGNVVSLNDVANRLGADLFRLYAISAADLGATLDYRQKDIESLRRRLDRLYGFWDRMLSHAGKNVPVQDTPMTRWALSKFANVIQNATQSLEQNALREYALAAFFESLNIHEHLQDRASESEAAYVCSQTLLPWISLLCPILPHACEEFWEKAGQKGFASTANWPTAPKNWFNPDAESQEDFLLSTVEDVQTILRLVKKKPVKITLVVAAPEKLSTLKNLLSAERPEDVTLETPLATYVKRHFYELRHRVFVDEALVLEKSKAFLEKRFGVAVAIEAENASQNPKKEKALPGKPAVYVE